MTATPEPSAQPIESPEPTGLPPLPEAAKENTPEGAEAFIRYYFDVVNELYMNPVGGVLPELSHAECLSCASVEEKVQRLVEKDESSLSEIYRVASMADLGGSMDGVITFNAVVELVTAKIVNESGDSVAEIPAGQLEGEVAAQWIGDSWTLFGLAMD